MIVFMLHHAGRKVFQFQFKLLTVQVKCIHDDFCRAGDRTKNFRQTQAAFFICLTAIPSCDLWIDKNEFLVLFVFVTGWIDHKQSIRQTHLIRRQADSPRRIHQFEHLLNHDTKLGVDPRHVFGFPAECRMRMKNNFKAGHGRGIIFQKYGLPAPGQSKNSHFATGLAEVCQHFVEPQTVLRLFP